LAALGTAGGAGGSGSGAGGGKKEDCGVDNGAGTLRSGPQSVSAAAIASMATSEANRTQNRRGKTTSSGSGGARREPSRAPAASKPEPAEPTAVPAAEPLPAPGLHLVATPIGNLGDITLRALATLRGVDRIFCEDTRVTARLLARYDIRKPLSPYHDHNAKAMRPTVIAALRRGERVALVSDAGTPLVSDPGYKLVREAIAEALPVTVEPGPSALLAALVLSGLPTDAFLFAGFLPARPAARRHRLADWRGLAATLVFFEATPRLAAALADMAEILGERPAAVGRELTKLHEEVRRAPLADLAAHYRATPAPRGEAVIVVGPALPGPPDWAAIGERLRAALAEGGVRDVAARLAAETGLSRSELYRRALAIRRGEA
jgi:16S rRNA (cytidine1402-2'-O)-methyltransferase